MRHDRTYYRACDTVRLIADARDSNDELAIALGERLEDMAVTGEVVRNLKAELREAEQRADSWQREFHRLADAMDEIANGRGE
jgi:hypothetical protein